MKLSKKWMGFVFVLILSGSIFIANGMGLGAAQMNMPISSLFPAPSFPAPTIIPGYSYPVVDATVTISDDKLKAALKTAAGLQPSAPIYKSDLAKLSGGLDLSNKSIAKTDGLQYCINITDLNLTGNKLTTLPSSITGMTNLQSIVLDGNKFTSMPDALFTMPKITSVSMAGNQIAKIPDKINTLTALVTLNLSNNKLDTISANIGKCTGLKNLDLSGNSFRLKSIPRDICLLPNLENLDVSGNSLSTLPDEIKTMPKLAALNVENNIIDTLPAGLGYAPSLQKVYAARNRLTIIEPSLYAGKVTDLSLDVNRLTDLPTGLSGKTFNSLSIEWNFIDMSDGTDARKIADSIIAPGGKNYMRQLKYISSPTVQATINTVLLKWQPLPEGTSGDGTWKVNKYQIYRDDNGKWVDMSNKLKPIAEMDKFAGAYVVTGLKADTSYKFQIGVEYSLTLNGTTISAHRFFTAVDAKTIGASGTVEPAAEPTVDPNATVAESSAPDTEPTLQPEPTETAVTTTTKGSNTTLLIVLIIIGAVAAIAVVGIVMMLMSKKNKRPY